MKSIVSEKGQVTIPKAVRDRPGLRPGTVLSFEAVAGKLVGQKADASAAEIGELLQDWGVEFVASTPESAALAGTMFTSYLGRRGKSGPKRLVADFLIGAHAALLADRVLARDRGYFRD